MISVARSIKVGVIALLIPTSFLIFLHVAPANAVEGSILAPKEGDFVEGVYEARGTVKDLPKGYVLWIAVRKGENFWPKNKAFIVGGKKWTATVDESATRPGGSYSLVLFAVDAPGQIEILDWYRINEESHIWPAMRGGIPGATALASVTVNR